MGQRFVDIPTAASLLGRTVRRVQQMCDAGRFTGAVKNGKSWQIPVTAHASFYGGKSRVGDMNELKSLPSKKREDAVRRLGLISEYEKLAADVVRSGGTRTEAMAMFCKMQDVGKRTLERYIRNYRDRGVMGLVDSRGAGKLASQVISDEAFEYFKGLYLDPRQLSVKICWDMVNFTNKKESRDWQVPSLRSMHNYAAEIPLAVRVLYREGQAAYEAKCAPYILNDPDSVEAGAIWVGDHHQFNCWIRHRNKWIRPWITAWEDKRSRSIVGSHITASPNQTTIMLAMKRAIETFGPPESVKIDNGRDYDSEMWTGTTKVRRKILKAGYIDEQTIAGIYAMMGIGVSFAIPYHPQSKPIERWFDTLDMQFTKLMPTYCGKDVSRKPEDLNDYLKTDRAIDEAYDLESFAAMAGEYIEVFNNSAHTGDGMDRRSPAQVMATRQSRRVIDSEVVDLLMKVWSGELTVGKNGVRFKGLWFGQYDAELMMYQGKKVRLAYDPDDMSAAYVYDATTYRLITIAEQAQLIRYGTTVDEDSLRNATKQKSRARKIISGYREASTVKQKDLTTLAIEAKRESIKPAASADEGNMKPVRTPLDGQQKLHFNLERQRTLKKAVGAEGMSELDIDLTKMKTRSKGAGITLFNKT